ncbi:MAG: hypothetical protein ACSLE9_06800 [Burkholderiaceae bacterium]
MANVDVQRSFLGVGKVLARVYGTTGRRRHVGNVSKLDLTQKLDTKKQKNYTRPGGGTAFRLDRLDSVEMATTWLSFSAENWALAVSGASTTVATGAVAAEVVTGYVDTTVALEFPPSAITTVKTADDLTTYVAGTDYVMSPAGFYVPPGSAIVDAASLHVAYTKAAHTRIEAAMNTGTELELLFEGLNEADSNKPAVINLWRVLVPASDTLSLIGDDLGKLDFKPELIADSTKGTGVSAFYRALIV